VVGCYLFVTERVELGRSRRKRVRSQEQTMSPSMADAGRLLFRAALVFGAVAGGQSAYGQPAPSGCQTRPQVETLDLTAPINIGLLKLNLVSYRCASYDNDVKDALARAREWIVQHVGEFDKPAVVLDIDETSLSNWEQIYHNDFAYIPSGACDLKSGSACGQREWELTANAAAMAPTLDLFNVAKTLKGTAARSPFFSLPDGTRIPSSGWRRNGTCGG
jgi:hypothetical protein